MATLYYGNGDCSIKATEIRGVELEYKGYINKLIKTTSVNFKLVANSHKILIYPFGEGFLDDLFSYRGRIKIDKIIAVGNDGETVSCSIKRVMDFSELLDTNAEDMLTNSEDLKTDYLGKKGLSDKDSNNNPLIENLFSEGTLYLKDDTVNPYRGPYHIHITDSAAMTGATHTPESQDLYFKQVEPDGSLIDELLPTRNPLHILPGVQLREKRKMMRRFSGKSGRG